uniref:Uncharacterized protein n=1 Tax=Salix viminalis TaxID=40686 RepID=A0A6N2K499_SALVM
MDGNKKRSIDGGKRGASIKKSKKDEAVSAQLKLFVSRLIQYLQHHKPTEVEQSILEKPCTDEWCNFAIFQLLYLCQHT